ncbi:MAG: hypothetical protein NVS1B10_08590 [Candidatus Saccharimonadales bacterium]
MSKPIQLPVLITSLSTKVDGSISIKLETRELNSADSATLFELRGAEAWTIIAQSEIKEEDVKLPTERPDPSIGTKTPSQRLRAVLYRVWQQSGGGTDFESYYRISMERVIDQLKDKLHD